MARIDQETVRKILDTADIVEVVSDFVKLRRAGANFMGLCPFHNERTPSFSVSKSRGICKCFSCGKGGTPVGFIMELEQLSYVEALKWLANKYNIEIKEHEMTDEERAASNERESMLALNDFALQFFEKTLTDTEEGRNVGLSYFRHRGLSDAVIKRFRLGFAPEQRDAFSKEAMAKGYSEKTLVDTGLCTKPERGGLCDRFRGRVMFPVFSVSGKVVAFGGRTLKTDKTVAKYVNSPESTIYHKSNELYGLYQAKREIIKRDKCILVEGYMDVISMSQRGVENIVASSGTSLTEGQIALIHRFTENVTVIYDSDPAGIKASLRGIDMLLAHGMHIKVMLLPDGEDPDSFAKSHTLEEIEEYMRGNETDFIRFKTKILLDSLADGDPIGRAGVINSIARSISVIPDRVERSEYIKLCARLLESDEEVITLQVAKYMNEAADKRAAQPRPEQPEETKEVTIAAKPSVRSTVDQKAYMRPTEMELVRLIARFGLQTVAQVVDADGEVADLMAIDYVRGELDGDEIRLTNPDLEKVYYAVQAAVQNWPREREDVEQRAGELVRQMREEARDELLAAGSIDAIKIKEQELEKQIEAAKVEFMAEAMERYLTSTLGADPDDEVRRLATSFASEKYPLSKIHTKNVHIPTEREMLPQKAPRAVCGVKIATLQWREKELRSTLDRVDADAAAILSELQSIRRIIAELARYLGERIVLPK
ncbi:MAG: DNA primase [Bacteroides sp.]|nr:DNA primase [Bacteroides sp.]MCM1379141.1 DNA primase [Bacteroides sp.]MCM1445335.1 DNA primase [Prevotella sp.]